MSVKELVDNALDICSDEGILPHIVIRLASLGKGTYVLRVRDNGPGIIQQDRIGDVFGRCLYGSKFHSRRQNRGQQGVGASAVVLNGQITTSKPTIIINKNLEQVMAVRTELSIDIKTNSPVIHSKPPSR